MMYNCSTVRQLKLLCKERGLKRYSKLRKNELIELLKSKPKDFSDIKDELTKKVKERHISNIIIDMKESIEKYTGKLDEEYYKNYGKKSYIRAILTSFCVEEEFDFEEIYKRIEKKVNLFNGGVISDIREKDTYIIKALKTCIKNNLIERIVNPNIKQKYKGHIYKIIINN